MSIDQLNDQGLENLISNYNKKGVTVGGKYTLNECVSERLRRKGMAYTGEDVTRVILRQSRSSPDNLVTYSEVWKTFYPDKKWVGHGSQTEVKKALDAAIIYCIQNSLPIVTSIVVQSSSRQLTSEAKDNIKSRVRQFGFSVHEDAEDFVHIQAEKTKYLSPQWFP
ncbi:hypothetical protein [Rhodovibrio salinarum]|uniref:hypothetical protein n=1 Tax=Rhodovibrio salinarum TaxID=1087 RepID=UPI0012DF13C2|nr:hypothetical protein [Rhodovibrio salinarum]